jgi:LysM repeat protein
MGGLNMNTYKTLVVLTLIVALLSACGTTPAGTVQPVSIPTTEATTIATVNTMQNLVEVGSPGNLINVPVSQAIYDNDAIRVTGGGIALLNFLDTTVLKLFNDTSIGGVNVEISPSTNKRLRMKLERGGLSGQVVKDSGGVGFEMPNGTHIYILGTSFYVTYDPTTDIVSAGNFDGTVAYEVPGQAPQFLPKGNLIDILPGGVVQVADMPFDINAFESAAQATGSPIRGLKDLRVVPTALPPTPTLLPTSCPIPEGWQSVIVQPSDTLDTIASRYHTTAEMLAQGNCVNTPDLVPGMVMYVPPLPAATACSHPTGWVTYIVQRGDNLYQIGLRYGVTVTTLQSGNCLDSSLIYTGQRLYVPNVPVVPPGPITISGNAVVGFATLSYVDGTAKTAAADGNGNYSFTVSYYWTGTVTPSKTGYTFSPASRSYSNVASSQTAQNYAVIVPPYALTVSKTGSGTITSIPAGIDCGSTCTYNFSFSTTVTLTATPALGSSFVNWSGACTGAGTCMITMDAAKSVTANFVTTPYTLAVSKIGAGTVTSVPAGIDCGLTCTYNFPYLTSVTLTATPSPGYAFMGWGGACTNNTGTCTVTMNAAKLVTANFVTTPYTLTVNKSGTGTVTSVPAGINCGATCSYSFSYFTSVTLTATPAPGYKFLLWSGACAGNYTTICTVTMDAAKSVTANFDRIFYTLTVSKSGINGGTVASVPTGIFCGSICTYNFPSSTTVTLTATAASGYSFSGWGGACTGNGICTVTMDDARSVTATFRPVPTLYPPPTFNGLMERNKFTCACVRNHVID